MFYHKFKYVHRDKSWLHAHEFSLDSFISKCINVHLAVFNFGEWDCANWKVNFMYFWPVSFNSKKLPYFSRYWKAWLALERLKVFQTCYTNIFHSSIRYLLDAQSSSLLSRLLGKGPKNLQNNFYSLKSRSPNLHRWAHLTFQGP